MADATNQGIPEAGGQLSGDVARNAAIKRLKKLERKPEGQIPRGPTTAPPPSGPPGGMVQVPVSK